MNICVRDESMYVFVRHYVRVCVCGTVCFCLFVCVCVI